MGTTVAGGRRNDEAPLSRPAETSGPADLALVSQVSQQLVHLIRAGSTVRAAVAARGTRGVEWSTYVLLFHLVRRGPQRPSALAEAGHVDQSTVSRQVAQLVRLGLAERRPDPEDGRAFQISATAAGRRVYEAMTRRRDLALAQVLSDWSAADLRTARDLLARLNDRLDVCHAQLVDAMSPMASDAASPLAWPATAARARSVDGPAEETR